MKLTHITVTCPVCEQPIDLPVRSTWPNQPYSHPSGTDTIVVTVTADHAPLDAHLAAHRPDTDATPRRPLTPPEHERTPG